MKTPGQELAALLVFDQEMAVDDAACVEQWAHRIDLALAAERERCAKIAEACAEVSARMGGGIVDAAAVCGERIAAAIRDQSNPTP
jgi:hypothetical protein